MSTSTRWGTPDSDVDPGTNDDLQEVWSKPRPSHSVQESLSSSSSFSSAVRRNETAPTKRRHAGSDAAARRARTDHEPWKVGDPEARVHVRARTLDGDVGTGAGQSRSMSHHPLKTRSGSASSSVVLEHQTRPIIKRTLSHSETLDFAREREDGDGTHRRSQSQDREMLVIVHEVRPTDSLAGVALKYGISLAELRRANQLWASDPIYLRETLYIPVEKARHVRHLKNAVPRSGDPVQPDAVDPIKSIETEALRDLEKYTLRRVPASQLSFFPPPSRPSPQQSSVKSDFAGSYALPSRTASPVRPPIPPSFMRSQDAPLQSVLDLFSTSLQVTANHLRAYAQSQSSLFAGLPMKPTTSLASRLSMESTSAAASTTSEEVDWEHELENFGNGHQQRRQRRRQSSSLAGSSSDRPRVHTCTADARATLKARKVRSPSPQERDSVELDSAPFSARASLSSSKHRRSSSSRSHSLSHSRSRIGNGSSGSANGHEGHRKIVPYVAGVEDSLEGWSSPPKGSIRTAQLEPSPGMQLPSLQRRRTKSVE
ncbi:hypothetical protein BD414DRAFT_217461 [Trametes punicea]|nr:hypothetical protein BD414DRAFT_217461 [Trametes punicea]